MNQHEEKIELLRKYYMEIRTCYDFHIGGNFPKKVIDNALKNYAFGVNEDEIIGIYDITVASSGKKGYVFTDTKVCYLEILEKPKKIWYDDIRSVELIKSGKKDSDNKIRFKMTDGSEIIWFEYGMNKTPLVSFFREMIKLVKEQQYAANGGIQYSDTNMSGAYAGGFSAGAYGTVNKSYDEEKFHARQGHGFAAERANNLYDKMSGHDAYMVGDNNEKNGADRIVDGINIQSKYCKTGSRCINECFENDGKGVFRYLNADGTPMQIEVPSDKYDAAVEAMKVKIERGQVNGVSDPAEAENIVRKGHFTYAQAKNIAKAGTVEPLTYDAVNGAVIATSALGVTALISFATSVWNGEDFDKSLKIAVYSGLKVGGTAFVTSILAGQLSKAGLNSALVGSSEAVVKIMGPKASAVLVNAFRNGKNIYGAAAMKSAAKLLRSNVITSLITVGVFSTFDIANIFRKRISGKQLFKNISNTAATTAGGTGGYLAGAAIGSAILPGVGTVLGGIVGSIAAGAAAGKATDKVLGKFIEDDAEEMVRIIQNVFEELAGEYLLNQKEAEKSVDKLSERLSGKTLKDMFASDDRRQFARELLVPIIEEETAKRRKVFTPSNEQLTIGLREVLEEISDSFEGEPAYS